MAGLEMPFDIQEMGSLARETNQCVKQIAKDLTSTNKNIEDIKSALEARLEVLENSSAVLKADHSKLQATNNILLNKIETLENKLDYLENQSRRNNIIMYGVPEGARESWEDSEAKVCKKLEEYLGYKLESYDVERAHRVGVARPNTKRPIVLKLNNYKDKVNIMKRSKDLRGTDIAVTEDFSERVKNEREYLKKHLAAAREQGYRAYLNFNKLTIDGEVWSVGNLKELDNSRAGIPPQDGNQGLTKPLPSEEVSSVQPSLISPVTTDSPDSDQTPSTPSTDHTPSPRPTSTSTGRPTSPLAAKLPVSDHTPSTSITDHTPSRRPTSTPSSRPTSPPAAKLPQVPKPSQNGSSRPTSTSTPELGPPFSFGRPRPTGTIPKSKFNNGSARQSGSQRNPDYRTGPKRTSVPTKKYSPTVGHSY